MQTSSLVSVAESVEAELAGQLAEVQGLDELQLEDVGSVRVVEG